MTLDYDAFENPFMAMEHFGKMWAHEGMDVEEMTAAAEQLGGLALGRNGPINLNGYASELIRQSQPGPQGE